MVRSSVHYYNLDSELEALVTAVGNYVLVIP